MLKKLEEIIYKVELEPARKDYHALSTDPWNKSSHPPLKKT
jgi:hypothetical protein